MFSHTEPPRIDRTGLQRQRTVIVGTDVHLYCPAQGQPNPVVVWYRNGTKLDLLQHPNIEVVSQEQRLVIRNIHVCTKPDMFH